MKSSYKRLAMVIMIISVLVISFGCTPKVEPKVEEELTLNYGFFRGIGKDGNSIGMGFASDGKNHTLTVEDKKLLDSLVPNEFYLVAYNKDNIVRSIQEDTLLKEMVLNTATVIPVDENGKSHIVQVDKVDVSHLTLLDEYIFDFNGDKTDEKISMYTAAERNSNGEIMWDDGQEWLLVVQGTDKDYVLFDDYVQLGSINFFVYTIDDKFYVDTMQVGTASLAHKTYAYDKDSNSFKITVQYTTSGNVNMLHSSKY